MPYVHLATALALSALALIGSIPAPVGLDATSPMLVVSLLLVLFFMSYNRTAARA